MEYKARIDEIETRAKRIGAALRDVCKAADVNMSTFYRWRQADANPRMRTMFRALDAMEADLALREARIVQQITAPAEAQQEQAA